MARRLAALLAVASMLFPLAAQALGLGEIRSASALNQNFDAEIALSDLDALTEQEILVALASPADFARAGIERSFFLSDLSFSVRVSGDRGVIAVRSARPITEPFVSFLLDVVWPAGRLQKEFTVLLDPPAREAPVREAAQPVAVPRATPPAVAAGTGTPAPRAVPERVPAAAEPGRSRPVAPAGGDSADMTDWGDTLWAIARRVRPQGATVEQTMLAIVAANPEAFIGGNVNLLKAGYRLRIPDASAITAIGAADAAAEVAEHARRWRSGEPLSQGAATTSVAPAVAAPEAPSQPARASDELVLSGAARPVTEPGSAAAAASNEALNASREEQDALRRDLDDARRMLAEQQARSSEAAAQAAARDSELQALRSEIESLRRQPPPAPAASGDLFTTPLGMALLAAIGVLAVAVVALGLMLRAARSAAQAGASARGRDEQLARTVRMDRAAPAAPAAAPAAAAATAASAAAATGRGQPATARAAAPAAQRTPAAKPAAPAATAEPARQAAPRPAAAPKGDDVARTVILPEAERVAPAARKEDVVTVDVVGEADIYIAYGRFPQAISFLRSALEKEPGRNDVRLKLMEVLVETKDVGGFTGEAQELLSRNPNESELRRARQLQARLPGADAVSLERVDAPAPNFDKTVIDTSLAGRTTRVVPATAAAVPLDVNLEDTGALRDAETALPLDVDLTAPAAAPPAAPAVPAAAAAPAELDFDLTLDGIDEQARPARDQLGGDLGLGFRDDAAAPRAEDASGLDLTLDGRHTPVPAARRAERPAADLDDTSGLDLTQGGETAPARPQPDAGVANARTVETTALEEEDLDFLNDADEAATKLDLARAYVDMGDVDGAREILGEVLNEGNDAQKRDAQELLARLK